MSEEPPRQPPSFRTLGVAELAALLHKTEATIYTDLCRAPNRLPPRLKLPGGARLIWLEETVHQWLLQHIEGHTEDGGRPKRGRPTKVEQMRRERERQRG